MGAKKGGDRETQKYDLVLGNEILYYDNPRCGWTYTPGKISIKNPTKNRYTYKVKCTNNEMFDIKVPVGFIESQESIDIEVIHVPGFLIPENDAQHLSVYYIKCDPVAQDYGPIWRSKKSEGCKHVSIRFPPQFIMTKEQINEIETKRKQEKKLKKLKEQRAIKEEENLEKERKEEEEKQKKKKQEEEEAKKLAKELEEKNET